MGVDMACRCAYYTFKGLENSGNDQLIGLGSSNYQFHINVFPADSSLYLLYS